MDAYIITEGKSELWKKFFEEEREKLTSQLSGVTVLQKPASSGESRIATTSKASLNKQLSIAPQAPTPIVPISKNQPKNIDFHTQSESQQLNSSIAQVWAEDIIQRLNNGEVISKRSILRQELLMKLLKMRGQVQREHERLLDSQRTAMLQTLNLQYEEREKELHGVFSPQTCARPISIFLSHVDRTLETNGTGPSSRQQTNANNVDIERIFHAIENYKLNKLEGAKESVRQALQPTNHVYQPTPTFASSANDNEIKSALKERLEQYVYTQSNAIHERWSSVNAEDREEATKLYKQNLAFAGQISLLQNILIQRSR